MVRVKICCIAGIEEVKLAIKYGASAVGLVSSMPSGPGVIPDHLIADIVSHIPPGISSFLLTSKQDVNSIISQQRELRTNTIQLCDKLVDGTYAELKDALPGISIVQVIHVTSEESVKEAINISEYVNGLLLDSGNPSLIVKELGGTGRIHNWDLSKKIVNSVNVPVFLAGGLNAGNVSKAINTVNPFGVDICSGVRTNGVLDEQKLSDFFKQVDKFC